MVLNTVCVRPCRRNLRVFLALCVSLSITAGCVNPATNFRVVEKGRVYRSGQMNEHQLKRKVRKHDIKTVINLRGEESDDEWYVRERAVCEEEGAAHYSFDWSKSRLPEPESLAALVELLGDAEEPIFIHCLGGTHRTGVASACVLLDRGNDLKYARKQLGLFFGDAPIGRVLDLYEGSGLPFREWVADVYPRLYLEEEAASN